MLTAQKEISASYCPFCKSDDLRFEGNTDGSSHWVDCVSCGASGPASDSQSKAVEKWNVRTYVVKRKTKAEEA